MMILGRLQLGYFIGQSLKTLDLLDTFEVNDLSLYFKVSKNSSPLRGAAEPPQLSRSVPVTKETWWLRDTVHSSYFCSGGHEIESQPG